MLQAALFSPPLHSEPPGNVPVLTSLPRAFKSGYLGTVAMHQCLLKPPGGSDTQRGLGTTVGSESTCNGRPGCQEKWRGGGGAPLVRLSRWNWLGVGCDQVSTGHHVGKQIKDCFFPLLAFAVRKPDVGPIW